MPCHWVCVCVGVLYTIAACSRVHMSGVVSCSALVGKFIYICFFVRTQRTQHNSLYYEWICAKECQYREYSTHTRGMRRARKKNRHTHSTNLQGFCPCAIHVLWHIPCVCQLQSVRFGYLRYGRFGCCVAGFLPCFRFHFVFHTMHTNVSRQPRPLLVHFKRKENRLFSVEQRIKYVSRTGRRWNNE